MPPPTTNPVGRPSPIPITINGIKIDPNSPSAGPEFFSDDSSKSNYILIQTLYPLNVSQSSELKNLKVTLQCIISENTYLCRFEEKTLSPISKLSFVTHTSVYSPKFVISPDVKLALTLPMAKSFAGSGGTPAQLPRVGVFLHLNSNATKADVLKQIQNAKYGVTELATTNNRHIIFEVQDLKSLESIALIDSVRAIELIQECAECNNCAQETIEGIDPLTEVSMDLKTHVDDAIKRYKGKGQIVIVADGGIDNGLGLIGASNESAGGGLKLVASTEIVAKTSKDNPNQNPAFKGRIEGLWCSQGRTPGTASDSFKSHGTHVCGSILGSAGEAVLEVPAVGEMFKEEVEFEPPLQQKVSIEGLAPEATLAMICIEDGPNGKLTLACYEDIYTNGPYAVFNNARIHNNSWSIQNQVLHGIVIEPKYTIGTAGIVDEAVFKCPDLLICRAAGNDGQEELNHISGFALAKNCITVGSCFSTRYSSNGKLLHTADMYSDKVKRVAAASSIGHLGIQKDDQYRFKPDIVAPGKWTLSTMSQDKDFVTENLKERTERKERPEKNAKKLSYDFLSGTSQATAHVSGCAAKLRQALIESGFNNKPSAALIKAILIHGAEDMEGGKYGDEIIGPAPNNIQGFGRLNLRNSMAIAIGMQGTIISLGTSEKNEIRMIPFHLPNKKQDAILKVTLVWTDRTPEPLQNKLALRVGNFEQTAEGKLLKPNEGRWGNRAQGALEPDIVNNVQQVVWDNFAEKVAQIHVSSTLFPLTIPQHYVVIASVVYKKATSASKA